MQDEPLELPPGYVLDASDPDVLVSRCSDGSSAAAFSARGAGPYGGVRGHRRRSAQPSRGGLQARGAGTSPTGNETCRARSRCCWS